MPLVWPSKRDRIVRLADTILLIETLSFVAPGSKKRASSFVPGGPLGDQLPDVSQRMSAPLAADQMLVAALAI